MNSNNNPMTPAPDAERAALLAAHRFVDSFVLGLFGPHSSPVVKGAEALRTQLGRAIDYLTAAPGAGEAVRAVIESLPAGYFNPTGGHTQAENRKAVADLVVAALATPREQAEPVAFGVVEREGGPMVALKFDREDASDWIVSASSEYRNQQCPGPSYRTLPLYTAPPADHPVVYDAMVERACLAYYNEPAWAFMSHKAECREFMRRALTAALRTPDPREADLSVRELAREIHYAIADDGLTPALPADNHVMRATIERVLQHRTPPAPHRETRREGGRVNGNA